MKTRDPVPAVEIPIFPGDGGSSMPVPKPHKNESREEFIGRCMSDPNMQEYKQDQRLGVCFTQWDNRDKGLTVMAAPKAPTPNSGESRNDFMSRCLKDPSLDGMAEPEKFSACAVSWNDNKKQYNGNCPTPNMGETQGDFMSRCMSDPAMDMMSAAEKLSTCTISWNDNQKSIRANAPNFVLSGVSSLPVKDGVSFDGGAASKAMLDAANIGGDNPDTGQAARGFVIVDSANRELRGSYHLPFADIVDGRLTAIGNGVRNALSRLPQMNGVSPELEARARSFLNGYMDKLHNQNNQILTPKTRAHSVIEIRSVDEERRIIEGIATTPATDRYNDIVEPMGASFSLPMPLLWQHNPDQPVGLVDVANATKNGIAFRATLPKITEPGILKDRIDEAWQTVKAGLVRGVSIGFKPISYEPIKTEKGDPTSGLRYTSWDWLELSLVTIPANAEATISAIRSFDNQNPRVRRNVVVKVGSPGATGNTRSNSAPTSTSPKPVSLKVNDMPKPITEQIADFVAVRGEKAARMQAIMDESAEKGETLDAAKQEEFDELQREIETVDQHLTRLRMMEKLAISNARPANGDNVNNGTTSRSGSSSASVPAAVIRSHRNLPPGIEFTRYAMCLMTARGNPDTALKIAESRYPDDQRIHNVLRAAVAAGTTTDPHWAGALTQYVDFAGDFIDFLRPATIIGKFGTNGIPALRSIPFNVRVKKQTSGGAAYWVGEGQPKPLTSFDFDVVLLRWAKIANIAVLTNEQVRFSTPSAELAVRSALADAIAQQQDVTFIDPTVTAIADTRPASITNGATAHASTGTDANAARVDAGLLMTGLATNFLSYSQAVWIMNSTAAISLFLMRNSLGQPEFPGLLADGGTFLGRPVIVSDNIAQTGSPASSIIVLMIPQEIYLSDDGQVVVDASTEASLQMDSAPTVASTSGSPATPTATTSVSMFQTNSIAIRAERYINWARRRDASVQYLTGAKYVA